MQLRVKICTWRGPNKFPYSISVYAFAQSLLSHFDQMQINLYWFCRVWNEHKSKFVMTKLFVDQDELNSETHMSKFIRETVKIYLKNALTRNFKSSLGPLFARIWKWEFICPSDSLSKAKNSLIKWLQVYKSVKMQYDDIECAIKRLEKIQGWERTTRMNGILIITIIISIRSLSFFYFWSPIQQC